MKRYRGGALVVGLMSALTVAGVAVASSNPKLVAPTGANGDAFGWDVAYDGQRVVIGAPLRDLDGFTRDSGTVYVFDAATGELVRELVPATLAERLNGDNYGRAVAAAGGTIVVGSPRATDAGGSSGEVFVFDASTGAQRANLLPTGSRREPTGGAAFGSSVDASPDRIVIGAPGTITRLGGGVGAVYLYDARTLNRIAQVIPRDAQMADNFGASVSVAASVVVAGSPYDDDGGLDAGAAYVLSTADGRQQHKLRASDPASEDLFGFAVAADGRFAAVAAPFDDDRGSQSGAVYIFDTQTGAQLRKITAPDGQPSDQFGISVDLVGETVVVGAWGDNGGAGSVYAFDVATGAQLGRFAAGDAAPLDILGRSVTLSGTTIVAGAPNDDDRGTDSGSAYLFHQIPT